MSQAIRERGGYQLMPEWETQPANQYLPHQLTTSKVAAAEPRFRISDFLSTTPRVDEVEQVSGALQKDLA